MTVREQEVQTVFVDWKPLVESAVWLRYDVENRGGRSILWGFGKDKRAQVDMLENVVL